MFDLRHLEHAIAVAAHGSFHRAADAIGISQPGLSRSIRELERRLGVRLFDRHHSGVELTPFGELVVTRGRSLLLDRDELGQQIQALLGLHVGSLTVDLGPYPAALYSLLALARLLADHPRISCRLRVTSWSTAIAAVLARETDLAIAELSEVAADPNLHTEPLVARPGWFVCRPDHDVLRPESHTVEDLVAWPWVTSSLPARLVDFLPGDLGRAGHRDATSGRFVPAVELEMMEGVGRIARDSDALVAVTLTMVESELERGELRVVPFAAPWFRLNAGFVTLEGRTSSPAVTAFAAIVRELEAELAEHEQRLRARFAPAAACQPG